MSSPYVPHDAPNTHRMALAITRGDERHLAAMEDANLTFLRVLRGEAYAPGRLLWRDHHGIGASRPDPDSETTHDRNRRVAHLNERDALAANQRVYRDPCSRCGVRADVGCKHQRTAA